MKTLLADDHQLFNEGFSLLLKKLFPDSTVIQANCWSTAKELARHSYFDLAILDLFMPTQDSWNQALAELISFNNIGAVCILTSSNNQDNVHQAFASGVKGYIHKSSNLAEIQKALHLVLNDKIYLPQLQQDYGKQAHLGGTVKLTARQHKILLMLAEGKGNRRIAVELNIKESTVKRHVYNICQQLQAKNRTEAVHIARQRGLMQNE